MEKFLTSNETKYKLLRTILEAALGVIIGHIDYLVGMVIFAPELRAFICLFITAILSPIMSELGKHIYKKEGNQNESI